MCDINFFTSHFNFNENYNNNDVMLNIATHFAVGNKSTGYFAGFIFPFFCIMGGKIKSIGRLHKNENFIHILKVNAMILEFLL